MTSIGTLRELDQAVEEAFDHERACENPIQPCGRFAAWWFIRPCGCVPLAACVECHDGWVRDAQGFGTLRYCRHCGSSYLAGDVRWEPMT